MCKSLVSRIIERYAASHAVRSASLILIVANIGPDLHLSTGLIPTYHLSHWAACAPDEQAGSARQC